MQHEACWSAIPGPTHCHCHCQTKGDRTRWLISTEVPFPSKYSYDSLKILWNTTSCEYLNFEVYSCVLHIYKEMQWDTVIAEVIAKATTSHNLCIYKVLVHYFPWFWNTKKHLKKSIATLLFGTIIWNCLHLYMFEVWH